MGIGKTDPSDIFQYAFCGTKSEFETDKLKL